MSNEKPQQDAARDDVVDADREAELELLLALQEGRLEGPDFEMAQSVAGAESVDPAAWKRVGGALRNRFEDAAEGAKPDLAGVADKVIARVLPPKPVVAPEEGLFAKILDVLNRFQPYVALAAATAALALVLTPMLTSAPATPDGPGVAVTAPETPEAPTSVVLRRIAFESGQGMVYRLPESDLTVIWVDEYEGV